MPRPPRWPTSPRLACGGSRWPNMRRLVDQLGEPMIAAERRAGAALGVHHPGAGQIRRPGGELSQRPGFDFALRGRRSHVPRAPLARTGETTYNKHFFSELGPADHQGLASQLGPHGLLYEIDVRLRPTGKSGALATSLDELCRYFAEGHGQLWERQALCKARVVYGSPPPRPPKRFGPSPRRSTKFPGARPTRPRSARCDRAWRTRPGPPTSNGAWGESSISNSSCRCCN